MGGSSGGTQTSTNQAEPWAAQKPYLKNIMGQAEQLYMQPGPNYYPGQTTVPFSPETEQSLAMQGARAQQGSPVNRAAKAESLKTLGGDYLAQGNPHLDALYNKAARPMTDAFTNAVAPSIASRALKAGRYGTNNYMGNQYGGAADILARNLGDLSASVYAPSYEAERGRMQNAAGMAPTLANQDYTDIARLAEVGGAREELGQRQIDENMNRWNYEQQLPANKLAQYLQFIRGDYGGTRTTSQPIYRNKGAGAVGGAMAGAQMGSMVGMPWLGAIGGGLLGAFS